MKFNTLTVNELRSYATKLIGSHAHPYIEIYLLSYVYIARYLQHMVTTIFEHIPWSYQFRSNPGSDPDYYLGSGSVVMTRFQYRLKLYNIAQLKSDDM